MPGRSEDSWGTRGASQVCVFFWAKLLIINCKPQNAEILVYSYSIFYRVVAFMTNLNAGVLLWFQEPLALWLFFLPWESVFSCTTYEVVKPGAAGEGCELPIVRWVCHAPMCGDDGKENAVFVILVLPHVGPCSSQPLAPGPPASTARVCSSCPGRKATATPSPSMAFWTASPTYIFWSELSCHHYTPTMCGEHWGIISACTEAAALHGRGRRLCRSCSGLTACSSHSR